MKKLIGLLLMVGGVFILLVTFAFSTVSGWFSNEWLDQDRVHDVESVSALGIKNIYIHAWWHIHVIPEERNDVKVELVENHPSTHVEVRKDGHDLRIEMDTKWYLWLMHDEESRLNVRVPKDYNHNMEIDSIAGNVSFRGNSNNQLMKLDRLELDVAAGDVDLQNLQINELKYDSAAGKMKAQWVTADHAEISSHAGDVQLDHFTGALRANLTSGNLKAQIDSLTGSTKVDTTVGDVELDLPQQADFTLEAKVTSGNIRSDFPHQGDRSDWEKSIKLTNGNGKNEIKISNLNGNIHIY